MAITLLILIVGFVLLIKGADLFVDGSSSIATKLHVPSLIIGLTVVAMGTSFPELSVSVAASLNGSNSLCVSNVLGSNIFNLLMVLGVAAILNKLNVEKDVLKRDFPISIICVVVLISFSIVNKEITRINGITLLIMFVIYMIIVLKSALDSRKSFVSEAQQESDEPKSLSYPRSIIYIIGGVLAIKIGGDWVVESAVDIAKFFNISETLIGLTIVSVGTSLPELVTSVVAAKKGELEMAVGNAVGSNIFNVLLILGTATAIHPVQIINENIIDIAFLIIASLLTFVLGITKRSIERKEGIRMVGLYLGYLVYIIMRKG